jgi:hypothetical protein
MRFLKGAGFVAASYAAGAVLFVAYVLVAIALEQNERAKRLHSY